jgi:hypothetical protein
MAASREAVTNFLALDHAKRRRLHSATTVICAYVTGGTRYRVPASNDARLVRTRDA